jgi:hypothetical protein
MEQNYNINRRIFDKSQSNPIAIIKSLQASIHFPIKMTQFILPGAQLGGRSGGQWCGHPGRQSTRGGKMNILSKNSTYCAQYIVNYSAKRKKSQ